MVSDSFSEHVRAIVNRSVEKTIQFSVCIPTIKLFGEEHESTADSYRQLGVTQYNMYDYIAALESHQRALAIRLKLFGEEHAKTADSYRQVKITREAQRKWRTLKRTKTK